MIRLIVENCEGVEKEFIFESEQKFIDKMNSDDIDIPMLDDKLIKVTGESKWVKNNTKVKEYYKYLGGMII